MPRFPLPDLSVEGILAGLRSAVSGIEFASFEVGVSSASTDDKAKARVSSISFLSGAMGKKHDANNFDLYLIVYLDRGFVEATPQPLHIYGRYNKFSREVAQTFHYCFRCRGRGRGCRQCKGTGKLSDNSVQEILEKIFIPAFEAKESKFHGCGREDVDVRMLGNGRPFVLELVEPKKRSADLDALEKNVNSTFGEMAAVHGLRFSSKSEVEKIKNAEFSKVYSCLCLAGGIMPEEAVKKLAGRKIEIAQRTPERVEKRRADKERVKQAEITSAVPLSGTEFRLEIRSSHGLYVKEFISGDNGRTRPSISELLGVPCRCKELDVLEIVLPGENGVSGK
ncbi:tRNA pseudouridine synthase Pus10 [uncultured archaeon]|nr:tRNA pseudouridine synthase Pus10 [uncultured archaeon]